MKLILRYIFIAFLGTVLLLSCEEEDNTPDIDLSLNMRVEYDSPEDSYINYSNLETASISYTVYSTNKNIERVDFFVTYGNIIKESYADEIKFETLIQSDFDADEGAVQRTYTAQQLAQVLGKQLARDLSAGDIFDFRIETTLTDGRVYPPDTVSNPAPGSFNFGEASNYTSNFFTYVGCPSEIVPGDYSGSPTNPSLPCSNDPFGQVPQLLFGQNIEITQTGFLKYRISDISAGYYVGAEIDYVPLVFIDICNTFFHVATCCRFNIVANGTHNPSTNQIDIQWTDLVNLNVTCENTYTPNF